MTFIKTVNNPIALPISPDNCIYEDWLKPQALTPTSPVDLNVHVNVTPDENGDLVPVIVAEWKARDDG